MTRQPTTERATKAARSETQKDLKVPTTPADSPEFFRRLQEKWKKEAEEAKTGTLDGEVSDITVSTAGDVYGDKAKDPARPVLHVEITASDGKKFHETFSQPEGAGSWRNSKFKLGQFLARYGSLPDVGIKVKIGFSEDGFYKLIL